MSMKLPPENLEGRILAIDLTKVKVFRCGGFSVNMNKQTALVTQESQQTPIRAALMDGRLIDVTDQNTEGLVVNGSGHTKPVLEDTGETVYITVGTNGAMSIAIPKDQAQKDEYEKRIADSGVLILDSPTISNIPSPLCAGLANSSTSPMILDSLTNRINTIKKDLE